MTQRTCCDRARTELPRHTRHASRRARTVQYVRLRACRTQRARHCRGGTVLPGRACRAVDGASSIQRVGDGACLAGIAVHMPCMTLILPRSARLTRCSGVAAVLPRRTSCTLRAAGIHSGSHRTRNTGFGRVRAVLASRACCAGCAAQRMECVCRSTTDASCTWCRRADADQASPTRRARRRTHRSETASNRPR